LGLRAGEERNTEIHANAERETIMFILMAFGLVFLVLWFLGLVTSYTLGGYIHVALVIGFILLVVSLVTRYRGRKL